MIVQVCYKTAKHFRGHGLLRIYQAAGDFPGRLEQAVKDEDQERGGRREDAQAGIGEPSVGCDREFFPGLPGHCRFSALRNRNCVMTSVREALGPHR